MSKIIGHIDMDAFFASVEERDKPYLQGLPIVIGADPEGGLGRGVVSTANYKARTYGISSALPIRKAFLKSEEAHTRGEPRAIFITPRSNRYSSVSENIFTAIQKQVKELHQVSVDEAYIIFKESAYEDARVCAQQIKDYIQKEHGLTASIGIGPNMLVAKIASDREKPDGLTVVVPDMVESFLAPLPIGTIPGIGKQAQKHCARHKLYTIGDAQQHTRDELVRLFGQFGHSIYRKVHGIGDTVFPKDAPRKSVGVHDTFAIDTLDLKEVTRALECSSKEVFSRFLEEGFVVFRTVVITVRFADFTTRQRSLTLEKEADTYAVLERTALKLLLPFLDARENSEKKLIRMLGVRLEKVSSVYTYTQGTLL